TSLFGHILGSNPQICGYYEMHIGYHSWKSLVRQKLLYFRDDPVKPGSRFMFDKVLHNDHDTALKVLDMRRCQVIFALREPQVVIPSILKLYAEVDPGHEFNSQGFATNYYIERLEELGRLAAGMQRPYFYLDAESLQQDTDRCLPRLGDWLGLAQPLSAQYELQRNSLRKRLGDSSDRMRAGEIIREKSDYGSFAADPEGLARATATYQRVRTALIAGCDASSLLGN
ncbi:MAG: hypothetical protein HKN19_14660, partial [Halioglobus sp.]|nr:hypothetical protein [Halioglobus sp.]